MVTKTWQKTLKNWIDQKQNTLSLEEESKIVDLSKNVKYRETRLIGIYRLLLVIRWLLSIDPKKLNDINSKGKKDIPE